jgi:addiction module RelE/StbE family toxin
MGEIIWSSQAEQDADEIYEYIAADSPRYAEMTLEKFLATVSRLASHPLSGRIVPEFNVSEIREVIVGNYRIVYRLKGEDVEIATIHHSARRLG